MERKRKKKSKEQSVWYQRKITLLYLIVLIMVIIMIVMAVRSIISYVENNTSFSSSSEDENEKYSNKHNASRFFFRVYYPDNWHVNAHNNGFWLDEEQRLVLELFPMVKVLNTQAPNATATPAPEEGDSTPDRLAGMVRDESLTAKFYYYDYTDEQKQWIQDHPSQVPEVSKDLTVLENRTDLQLLDKIAQDVYAAMTGGFDATIYTWDEAMTDLETTDITFKTYSYQYTKEEVPHTADVYIAVRASNYYVIVYDGVSDGTDNSYKAHKNDFLSIMEEFRFSVFEE